ncbi:hypothetical protein B0H11DRAFT_2253204 [Mycena galericulata]|nr:hypothetical protein B0H11DRAFT_2253204 [Mycena galericulata]
MSATISTPFFGLSPPSARSRSTDISVLIATRTAPDFLPNLYALAARPVDVPTLLDERPVVVVRFEYRRVDRILQPRLDLQILALSTRSIRHLELMACQLVDEESPADLAPKLKYLRISQDASWGEAGAASGEYPQLVADLCKKLVPMSRLDHLVISTRLGDEEAHIFRSALVSRCQRPFQFVFHTQDRCFMWKDYLDTEATVLNVGDCDHS